MKEVIEKFYTAFAFLDAETMVSCYHTEVEFEDPAFGKLKGEHAKNMWRMLMASQKKETFRVAFSNIIGDENMGSAHWEAFYTFSKTGRKVHNIIDAKFSFQDGLIIRHTDHFNLHTWAKQALGFKGLLLGGTAFFKTKLNAQTNHLLQKYEAQNHEK